MSLFDIFKVRKYKEEISFLKDSNSQLSEIIAKYKNDIETLKEEISAQSEVVNRLSAENGKYKSVITDDHNKAINIKLLITDLEKKYQDLLTCISQNEQTMNQQLEDIRVLKQDFIQLNDEILYQSFGLYEPLYDFATSAEYKSELENIRNNQKQMIKDKEAATCQLPWQVNDSSAKGRKMINDNIKQSLRLFNIECENAISNVRFNNFESMEKRIAKSFEILNNLNKVLEVNIEEKYLDLKYQELHLAYEYAQKKQEEKEEIRIQRELAREEQKVIKELEEKRAEIEKEQQHYQNILRKINEQIILEKSVDKLAFLQVHNPEQDGQ